MYNSQTILHQPIKSHGPFQIRTSRPLIFDNNACPLNTCVMHNNAFPILQMTRVLFWRERTKFQNSGINHIDSMTMN